MLKSNIQSTLYEFFTHENMQYWECQTQDLGFLSFQHNLQLPTNASPQGPSQTYQNLLDLWHTKQSSDKENKQGLCAIIDFFKYCKFHTKQSLQDFPKIIICSSDELELGSHALYFLQTYLHSDLKKLAQHKGLELPPIILPDIRLSPYDSTQTFYEEFHELFAKLSQWYENNCTQIILTPPHTLMAFLPNAELLHSFTLTLKEHICIQELLEKLQSYGYEGVEIVEMQGEFSWRADIVDIFIPNSDNPIRISFFDTEIESIRYFNYETQLSQKEEISQIHIHPAMFSLTAKQSRLLEAKIANLKHDGIEDSINSLGFWFLKDIGGINLLEKYPHIFTLQALKEYKENLEFIMPEILPSHNQCFKIFNPAQTTKDIAIVKPSNLHDTIKLNAQKKIFVLSPTHALLKSLDLDMTQCQSIITPFYFNITTESKLFLALQKIQKTPKKHIKLEIDSLKVGEFVVHHEYGIGVFECIKQVAIMGGLKDFISILYANDDRLLLPIENLNLIEKYSAYDSVVKIDKLGKSSFMRLKDSIKEKLLEIANEIILLQAQRELSKGKMIVLESAQQIIAYQDFEEKRGFELTQDQNIAITESLKDLKSGKVMDRLLNGDVGFGKTEVAMSLCYATLLNDFLSIVLVPTTLLCNQHFKSFHERFKTLQTCDKKPIHIVKLDRFVTTKQKKVLEKRIKEKSVHIIIGTHSLFNLELENLGLIVIDEEHKFGVKQKEILKQKSLTTHVLSMSATPIPRTLNMVYSKLKAISELQTPPFFKQESKTFVKIKKDSLIKEVITRELRRGGQVFYIFNNIAKITTLKSYLLKLLPKLRILILHSQVNPKDTEKGMIDFLNKNYDVLLCTSIVESGIHIPNANTIIVDEAHRFGMADLHQLRGRVGRGKAHGFCYLLTHAEINEESAKRLLALEKNSYLGSGAQIAYHDLEIRGGGNLLGQAQSGHIRQVGFSMYVHMLEETLGQLLQNGTQENKVDLKLSVSAFLNERLIASERMRLEIYRRLSLVANEQEVHEIEGEIEQRFGKLDLYSLQFLELIIIKTLALQAHIKAISNANHNIVLTHHDNTKIYLQSPTKDDDDILLTIKTYLKNLIKLQKNTK